MAKYNYKHVFVIGIDGAGTFVRDIEMPRLQEIFKKSALTYNCLTTLPTISAQCWGSLLLGVDADVHGLTNGIVEENHYANSAEHPSFMRLARDAFPDAKLGAYCAWWPIHKGIIEHDIGVDTDADGDHQLTPRICDYIKQNKPKIMFVQLDSVDGMGHGYGYRSEKYYEFLQGHDELVGMMWDAIEEAGILEDSLVIFTADHGGYDHGHGGPTDEERWVFFSAAGKTVAPIRDFKMRVRDIPAIVCCALGIDTHKNWDSYVPAGLFTDVEDAPVRPDIDQIV